MEQMCQDCLFWAATPGIGGGKCQRYAPKPLNSRIDKVYWPRTESEDWCGEWQPK